jgi:hypothetical protein
LDKIRAPGRRTETSKWRALRLINQPRIISQWGVYLRYAVPHFYKKRGLTPRHYWAGAKRIFTVLFYFFSFYI